MSRAYSPARASLDDLAVLTAAETFPDQKVPRASRQLQHFPQAPSACRSHIARVIRLRVFRRSRWRTHLRADTCRWQSVFTVTSICYTAVAYSCHAGQTWGCCQCGYSCWHCSPPGRVRHKTTAARGPRMLPANATFHNTAT
jgi:hypothetical protein